MSKKQIKTNVKFNEGICPLCGGELEYIGPREIDDSGSTIPWHCTKCGAYGNEGYTDVFDAHYNVEDQDGNEVEFEPLPMEPMRDDGLLCEAGDVIDNAVQDLLNAISAVPVEWDMSVVAQVKDAVEGVLKARNIPVCIPWENEEEHICYSLPDERCTHCTRSCSNLGKLTVTINGDDAIVMSIHDDVLRVDWYNAGEGICGDFNHDDPNDINFLRFDVYVKSNQPDKKWLEVEDASYRTNMPATASEDVLEKALKHIFKRYRGVISGPTHPSVKDLGEELCHISKDIYYDPASDRISVNMDIILTPTTLVKNDFIKVRTTGHDYDIVATVQNLTEDPLCIRFTGEAAWIKSMSIAPDDMINLLADTEGYYKLEALVNERCEYRENNV